MSGGRWNYGQCNLGYDMYPGCDVCYGLGDDSRSKYSNYTSSVKRARKLNPMEDKQISELVFDVLCLVYSADWYQSGDTGEDTYRADVEFFKKKWLGIQQDKLIKTEIDKSIEELREELYKSFASGGAIEELKRQLQKSENDNVNLTGWLAEEHAKHQWVSVTDIEHLPNTDSGVVGYFGGGAFNQLRWYDFVTTLSDGTLVGENTERDVMNEHCIAVFKLPEPPKEMEP